MGDLGEEEEETAGSLSEPRAATAAGQPSDPALPAGEEDDSGVRRPLPVRPGKKPSFEFQAQAVLLAQALESAEALAADGPDQPEVFGRGVYVLGGRIFPEERRAEAAAAASCACEGGTGLTFFCGPAPEPSGTRPHFWRSCWVSSHDLICTLRCAVAMGHPPCSVWLCGEAGSASV